MPPKELIEARSAYDTAQNGPAAQVTPAEVHVAKQALDKAEAKFSADGDEPETRDIAYIAARKAQLADSAARVTLALKAKQASEAEAQRFQGDSLRTAQSDLANTKQNLEKTQDQLAREALARQEAEKKAAQAMADLQKLANVKQEPRGMVITLSGSVLFATDQSTLLPTATTKLDQVADALVKGNPDANITIEGHTDSQGQLQHNMDLSQRRAESVKAQLVSRGVAADRIKTVGVGPDRPIADNKSPEGRANNRRVEIIVGPQKQAQQP
ncbi:MAG: outer membrane protein [Labilithrix sp.]|nr:outer membrane protein [Labilithrix sp.]